MSEQTCVVCGQGSSRDDWIKKTTIKGKTFVACDNHSMDELKFAASKIVESGIKVVPEAEDVS